jgi:hypothetical protein
MLNICRGLHNPVARIRICRMQLLSDRCDGQYCVDRSGGARAVGQLPPHTGIDATTPEWVCGLLLYSNTISNPS